MLKNINHDGLTVEMDKYRVHLYAKTIYPLFQIISKLTPAHNIVLIDIVLFFLNVLFDMKFWTDALLLGLSSLVDGATII